MAIRHGLVVGYTTRRHLLLDLDNTTFSKVVRLVKKIIREWPEVGSCLILQSSDKPNDTGIRYSWNNAPYMKRVGSNFHLVFNNYIGWNKCCKIAETLAGLKVLEKDYEKIRTFRGDMTLRISEAETRSGVKPAPVALCAIASARDHGIDNGITDYLNLTGITA